MYVFCILLPDHWKTNFYIHGKNSARYKSEYAGNFSWLACWGVQFFILDTRKIDLFESKVTETVFCTGMWGARDSSKYTLSHCSFCWCFSLKRTRWKGTPPAAWNNLYANCLVSTLYLLTNLYLKTVFSAKKNSTFSFFFFLKEIWRNICTLYRWVMLHYSQYLHKRRGIVCD